MKDEALVAEVLAGDVDAYGELMDRYESRLNNYVTYLLGNSAVSADAVQETFIKAYQNLRSYNSKYAFSSWIYRIAHNTAITLVKKYKYEQFTSEIEVKTGDAGGHIETLEESLDNKLLGKEITYVLQRLDVIYREPLILSLVEHKSYKEIAEILELPMNTVATRIRRAKEQTRKLLEIRGIKP